MNKITVSLLVLLSLALAGVGASFALQASSYPMSSGKGNPTEYTRDVNVGNFNAIDASISIDVHYTPSQKTSVRIVAT